IAMHEKPGEAVRAKPNSSLVVCCRTVAEGDADVAVSAGNTGAMLAAGLLALRRLPGVLRPAIAVVIPAQRGPSVLLAPGADPDTYGGAYLLGLRGLAVIAHGNSSRRAIANAIRLGARGVDHRVVERLAERMPDRVVASARSSAPTNE